MPLKKQYADVPAHDPYMLSVKVLTDGEKATLPGIGYRHIMTNARPAGSAFEMND